VKVLPKKSQECGYRYRPLIGYIGTLTLGGASRVFERLDGILENSRIRFGRIYQVRNRLPESGSGPHINASGE